MYLLFMSLFCLTEMSGPAFDEFLELIGKRVALKGFEGYRAQLDNRSKFETNRHVMHFVFVLEIILTLASNKYYSLTISPFW